MKLISLYVKTHLKTGHMSSVAKGKLKDHKGYGCKKVGNN